MDALAPDAVLIADGGGVVAAVRQPVVGAKKIVNLLGGFARFAPTAVVEPVLLNGAPGARVLLDGAVDTVIGFAFEDGRISRVFAVRNPDKLHGSARRPGSAAERRRHVQRHARPDRQPLGEGSVEHEGDHRHGAQPDRPGRSFRGGIGGVLGPGHGTTRTEGTHPQRLWRPGTTTGPSATSAPAGPIGWQVEPSPNPTTSSGLLNAVSCAGPSACIAVGWFENATGDVATFAEHRDGTAWTLQVTPNPAGAPQAFLQGVSCVSPSFCVAVGYYFDGAGWIHNLAERWDGTASTCWPST